MSSQTIAPLPKAGLPAGVQTGPLGSRFVAQLIDAVLPALCILVAVSVQGTAVVVLATVVFLAWVGLVWWMVAKRAASPGMRAMKLQVVGLRDGRPPGWSRVAIRELVLLALTVTVIGLLVMLYLLAQHPRKQGWHDLLAETVVIRERPLAPPLSAPATPAPPATVSPAVRPPSPGQSAALTPPATGPRPVVTIGQTEESGADSEATGWRAVLDDGRALEITGLVLLGRNPQPRPGEDDAELVKIADDTRTVSKTHLALSVDPDGLAVMDRGSTNGSTVTDTRGDSTMCQAGMPLRVADGSIVSFGQHWLRIEHQRDR